MRYAIETVVWGMNGAERQGIYPASTYESLADAEKACREENERLDGTACTAEIVQVE